MIKTMPRYTKISTDKLYNLFEEYADNEGLTIAQIADRENIDLTVLKTLFNRIANHGDLETRNSENVLPKPRITSDIINQIVHLRTCKFTFKKISERTGFSESYIHRLYQKRLSLLEKYDVKHKDGLPLGNQMKKFKELLNEERGYVI